ncbi:Chemotaxis protein PomA [bioreactor metagenome]|uniref:Chemotaxis protein PomA n=1 Tax=bioreactor metagenome TaxID=1076179 RepID=A0A645BC85_9ZZZZ|nr:MotA/TolQ/ExbB proton channel family protein [Oscillospiraceae bacterium]
MDIASILGLIIGFGSIAGGYAMDGGNVGKLLMASAFVITLGGSLGAVFACYGMNQLKNLPKMLIEVLIKPKSTIRSTMDYLLFLSKTARESGLLSLEKLISAEDPKKKTDPFLKRGILMVVDGTDPDKISDILSNDIYVFEQNRSQNIQMLDSFAAFCPAFGMVGTIIGLIQVLAAGMEDPNALTKAIGVAFITTLYGVLLANLIFIPTATKLRSRLANYRLEKEMIIEAVCSIRNSVNPRLLNEQLSSYLIIEGKNKTKASKDQSDNKGQMKK